MLTGVAREEAEVLLPPSGGPTQAGTTPSLTFRAMLVGEYADLDVSFLASREVPEALLVPRGLPVLDGVYRIDQHEDVEQ